MKLFTVVDNNVHPTEEALNTYPYDEIWTRDTTPKKDLALREYAYIEFMCSPLPTNNFYGYVDEVVRSEKIIENKFSRDYPNWEPDQLVMTGLDQFKEFLTNAAPNLIYYESNRIAQHRLSLWLRNINPDEVNDRGAPRYKPKDITSALMDCDTVMQRLDGMEKTVNQQLFDKTKTKGGRQAPSKFEQ